MTSRRRFLGGMGAALAGVSLVKPAHADHVPEPSRYGETDSRVTPPPAGKAYRPVVTLNGWTLPFRMNDGVKEFHLVAEPVERELAPGMVARLWGYNGQSPGPTLECVEGDRVRIFVTNRLPEHTTIHWHGLLLPSGMDGVGGLSQATIQPGETWVYEFEMKQSGTFLYHPHADEMLQIAMGMMGAIVVHPKNPRFMPVDRDYLFLLSAYDIEPGSSVPKATTMTEFNLWTFNTRVFPGIDPLVARTGERVRIRVGNLTMTNHPIHLHGHILEVTGTDGGWIPKTARWPEVTVDVGVGQVRVIEFNATAGDWALHCHKSHHTMNAMGHAIRNPLGVSQAGIAERIARLVPDYMSMGETGMAEMSAMPMPLPENTLPMMTGEGPYGSLEMGGMFTVLKVRDNQPKDDYRDPGWFPNPPGTQARRIEPGHDNDIPPTVTAPASHTDHSGHGEKSQVIQVRKPGSHQH